MTTEKVWLCRGGCLVLMVVVWLLWANALDDWRIRDELLARGKITVAEPRKGIHRWLPEKHEIIPKGRGIAIKQRKSYTYVVDGAVYEDYTTGEANPVGQIITYLPEDPTVHSVGVIQTRSTAKTLGAIALCVVFAIGPTFGFFLFCVLSPGQDEPTRQGGWIILGLGTGQCALVFTVIPLVRQPVLIVITQYVPAFMGGTIAVLLGVRFFARGWGIKLGNP